MEEPGKMHLFPSLCPQFSQVSLGSRDSIHPFLVFGICFMWPLSHDFWRSPLASLSTLNVIHQGISLCLVLTDEDNKQVNPINQMGKSQRK